MTDDIVPQNTTVAEEVARDELMDRLRYLSIAVTTLIIAVLVGCGAIVTTLIVNHNHDVAVQQAKDQAQQAQDIRTGLNALSALCQVNPSQC